MMIVWELQDTQDMLIQGKARQKIFSAIQNIIELFNNITTELSGVEIDSYSNFVSNLKMGFGLAKGHAWRLDFGHKQNVDYAGSIINLAARLQNLARPEGIVSQLELTEFLFRELEKNKIGIIKEINSPSGLGNEKNKVFMTKSVVYSE